MLPLPLYSSSNIFYNLNFSEVKLIRRTTSTNKKYFSTGGNCKNFNNKLQKTEFDFEIFKQKDNAKFEDIPNNWLEWFVGFVEGDGTFAITYPTNPTNTQEIITFEIKLSLVDEATLKHIKTVLGFGFIYTRATHSIFRVKDLQNLKYIIHLFNGNLVLPYRKRQFSQFLEIYNKKMLYWSNKNKPRFDTEQITFQTSEILPTLKDAWISGFADAEGCFSIWFNKKSRSAAITFNLSQSKIENLPILKHLITVFSAGTVGGDGPNTPEQFYFLISGSTNCLKVCPYFEKYPLKTIKLRSFAIWKNLNNEILLKRHLDSFHRPRLLEMSKLINPRGRKT
jgi:hypothetical protein